MRNSVIERELDRLHMRFVEAAFSMCERGVIDEAARDRLIGVLERIDECDVDEIRAVLGRKIPGGGGDE